VCQHVFVDLIQACTFCV